MPFSDRLELMDYLLIPMALVAIAIGAIKLTGRGDSISKMLATITFRGFSLSIVALALTVGSALYVLERRREGGSFELLGNKKYGITILEVEEVPRNYLIKDKLGDEKWTQIFEALVQSLALRENVFCLHIHFEDGRGKFRVLLKKRQDTEGHLVSLVQSQLPGFTLTVSQVDYLSPSLPSIAVRQIGGYPQHFGEEVSTPVSKFFEHSRATGDYIAFFQPFKPSHVTRSLLNRKYRKLSGRAMKGKMRRGIGSADTTEQTLDFIESKRLERTGREMERLTADYALKAYLYLVVRAESEELVELLAGDVTALIKATLTQDAKDSKNVRKLNPERFRRNVTRLVPTGKPVVMHPTEARSLFQFPRISLGITMTERAGHPLPPASGEGIVLGNLQVGTRVTPEETRIPVEALAKQVLVAGSTGSGKTSFILNLLLDAYRNRIPFIVLSPVKREYRALIRALPEALLFTVGNEQVTPLRFNPLLPPSGTLNQAHVDNFRAAFEASYPLYPPMPYVLSQCLTNAYRRKGWNLLGYERGELLLLTHLHREVEEYTRSLGYEMDIKKDVEAALKIRLERLTEGALGMMLNTSKPFPLDLFLSVPTIFEFEDLADDREKALIIALLLIAIREKVQTLGPSERTRLVIVIEEAHRLLTNIDTYTTLPDAADARRGAIQYISNMLAEMRAYGVGIILVDQIPSKLFPDAIKNTGTKVVFRLVPDGDRKILGATMNLDEQEVRALLSQQPGEATVFTESASHAYQIRVPDLVKSHGIKPSIDVTDEELRGFMRAFYQRHPLTIQPENISAHPDPVRIGHTQLGEAGTPFCDVCSPNPEPENCVLRHIAAEVLTNPDVQRRLTQLLSDSTDIDELADYLLKLSEIVLGEENAKLGFCILAQTPHEKVKEIVMTLHRTLENRIKEENNNERDTET